VAGRSTIQDSLLIDLSALMIVVLVDPRAGVARAQGGATWGMSTGNLMPWPRHHGRRSRLADVPLSAVARQPAVGRSRAGGRPHRQASEREASDLCWAVRGGGGNFGVATSFEYRLHKVGPLVIGELTAFPFGAAWGPSRGPRRSSRQQTVYRCTTADPQSINPAPIMPLSGQHPWIGHRALNYPEFGVLAVCSCVYPRQPLPADGNPADRPRDPGADPSPWFGRW
jgi:hypothetical protein